MLWFSHWFMAWCASSSCDLFGMTSNNYQSFCLVYDWVMEKLHYILRQYDWLISVLLRTWAAHLLRYCSIPGGAKFSMSIYICLKNLPIWYMLVLQIDYQKQIWKKSDEETKSRLVLLKLLATALSTAPITSLLTSQALMKELKRPWPPPGPLALTSLSSSHASFTERFS